MKTQIIEGFKTKITKEIAKRGVSEDYDFESKYISKFYERVKEAGSSGRKTERTDLKKGCHVIQPSEKPKQTECSDLSNNNNYNVLSFNFNTQAT